MPWWWKRSDPFSVMCVRTGVNGMQFHNGKQKGKSGIQANGKEYF
jgi:hypothetical protein